MSITFEKVKTGIPMTKENILGILGRARAILSNPDNWGTADLRRSNVSGKTQYCVLGAIEQAAYDLGLKTPGPAAFKGMSDDFSGYALGEEISLYEYSKKKYNGLNPFQVNDTRGYEKTLELLDGYIDEVQSREMA